MTGTKRLVIAMGNRFRGDDGLGPAVADRLKSRMADGVIAKTEIVEGSSDAMALVNAWDGSALTIVVDAAMTGAMTGTPPGTILRWESDAEPLPKEAARCSSHGLGLAEALALGKILGKLPGRLIIHSVEAKTFEAGSGLSPDVEAAVEELTSKIVADLSGTVAAQDASEGRTPCTKPL